MNKLNAFALAGALMSPFSALALDVSGVVQVSATVNDTSTSWQGHGTGTLRYDANGIQLQQTVLRATQDLGSDFSIDVVANAYQDGEQHIGLSQAQLIYKPLMASPHKWQVRAGFFYPGFSLENVDIGWLSPYNYTNSAINSWLGEELRAAGVEISQLNPGRPRRSAWSWDFHLGFYRGNDPLGTLISWRGWATHDRQSLNNDRVNFAPYPPVVERARHPDWIEPFHEIDGRTGYYIGTHVDYFNKTRLRYYYYDNNADPLAVNDQRLYAWHTRFHSLAFEHRFNSDTKVIAQWMLGDTEMGRRWVFVDFDAWYVLVSHTSGEHRFSIKAEQFRAREDDKWAWDPNNSDGKALTVSWRYNLDEYWQIGAEYLMNNNQADNRALLDLPEQHNERQAMAVAQYRW